MGAPALGGRRDVPERHAPRALPRGAGPGRLVGPGRVRPAPPGGSGAAGARRDPLGAGDHRRGAVPQRDAAHAPFLRPRPPKPRPSTAPALVDAVESEAAGPRAGAPQRSTRRVQGDGFARTLTLRPRAHPETRSRLAAVDAAARAAFVRRQRGPQRCARIVVAPWRASGGEAPPRDCTRLRYAHPNSFRYFASPAIIEITIVKWIGPIRGLVFGAFGEISEEARTLLCYAADATAARTWVADGATSEEHAAALLKNRLYRRWGIKTAREYARIKIDGLRLVGGNPDFTNPPGHGDDDARFYDRQVYAYTLRGGCSPSPL